MGRVVTNVSSRLRFEDLNIYFAVRGVITREKVKMVQAGSNKRKIRVTKVPRLGMRYDPVIENPITSSYYAICLQYIAVIAVPIASLFSL